MKSQNILPTKLNAASPSFGAGLGSGSVCASKMSGERAGMQLHKMHAGSPSHLGWTVLHFQIIEGMPHDVWGAMARSNQL